MRGEEESEEGTRGEMCEKYDSGGGGGGGIK